MDDPFYSEEGELSSKKVKVKLLLFLLKSPTTPLLVCYHISSTIKREILG